MAPSTVRGSDTRPPTKVTASAFSVKAMIDVFSSRLMGAISITDRAAIPNAMAQTTGATSSSRTPMRREAAGSSDTARMAMPRRVRRSRNRSPTNSSTTVTTNTIWS